MLGTRFRRSVLLVARALTAAFFIEGAASAATIPVTNTNDTGAGFFTDVAISDSYCKHVHYLWARNVIAGCTYNTYCPTGNVTRGEMAKFLGNAFDLLLYGP